MTSLSFPSLALLCFILAILPQATVTYIQLGSSYPSGSMPSARLVQVTQEPCPSSVIKTNSPADFPCQQGFENASCSEEKQDVLIFLPKKIALGVGDGTSGKA